MNEHVVERDLGPHALSPARARYLAAARTALELLRSPDVATRWDEASVLAQLTVGDLAGHLTLSGVLLVEMLLDGADPAAAQPVSAGEYYGAAEGLDDLDAPINVDLRSRSRTVGVRGAEDVARAASDALERLADRLSAESAGRQVLSRGLALTLDEFLRSRCVELAVHVEDLELSVGLGPGLTAADPVPEVPDDVLTDAVDVLVTAAVARHGTAAVLRALTRRERDQVQALRVF